MPTYAALSTAIKDLTAAALKPHKGRRLTEVFTEVGEEALSVYLVCLSEYESRFAGGCA